MAITTGKLANAFTVRNGITFLDSNGENTGITVSNGSPEGVVEAPIGTLCIDYSVGALYKKTTATGNTGWSEVRSGGAGGLTPFTPEIGALYDSNTFYEDIGNEVTLVMYKGTTDTDVSFTFVTPDPVVAGSLVLNLAITGSSTTAGNLVITSRMYVEGNLVGTTTDTLSGYSGTRAVFPVAGSLLVPSNYSANQMAEIIIGIASSSLYGGEIRIHGAYIA